MRKLILTLAILFFSTIFFSACRDDNSSLIPPPSKKEVDGGSQSKEDKQLSGDWECVFEQWNTTITLRIDTTTNLVSVSKSPKEMGYYDVFHQFRDGTKYLLKNDTLHLITSPYDSYVFCNHSFDFAITRLSEDAMKVDYFGGWWMGGDYMSHYLFNHITL